MPPSLGTIWVSRSSLTPSKQASNQGHQHGGSFRLATGAYLKPAECTSTRDYQHYYDSIALRLLQACGTYLFKLGGGLDLEVHHVPALVLDDDADHHLALEPGLGVVHDVACNDDELRPRPA